MALGPAVVPAKELAARAPAQWAGGGTTAVGTTTVSRSLKALSYRRAGKSVQIDFAGTDLMSTASGTARVESKSNRIEVDAKFIGLQDSTRFGLEYLTYVLW